MTAPANTIQVLHIITGRETPKRYIVPFQLQRTTNIRSFLSQTAFLKRCFLGDTGAQVSVTPASKLDKKTGPRGPPLQAANGSTITTYGTRVVCFRFGQRNFQARLIAADVSRPLLGADFLRTHNLLVDMRNRRLIEADIFSGISCYVSTVTPTNLALVEPSGNKFRKLLNEFPDLLKPTFSAAEVKHGVHHFIPTKDRPVFARTRRLAPDRLAIAKKEFSEMEKMGIIRKAARGHLLSIWYPNQTVAGAHAATTEN